MKEFEEDKDKVMMGTERRSMVMTEDEKKMTAYHEAGHAIVAMHEPASDPIHKATIIPRGRALGMVMRLPERDNYSYHRDKMYANLAVSMGGRVAEEVIFGYARAKQPLTEHVDQLHALARSLLEFETLTGDEIKKVLAGEPIDRGGDATKPRLPASGTSIPSTRRPKGGIGGPAAQGA